MPARQELVANRPLRGDELAKIILADVTDILARDCMMTSRVAYGRIAYEIKVVLHMDNPAFKESETVIRAKAPSDNMVEARPELAAIEGGPPLAKPWSSTCANCDRPESEHDGDEKLCRVNAGELITRWEPSTNSYVSATQRDRTIDSPNVARIEHGLPITVIRQGHDTGGNAMSVEEGVLYPPETVQDVSVPPKDHDLTRQVKQAFTDGSNLL
jgi:hypothetical protein